MRELVKRAVATALTAAARVVIRRHTPTVIAIVGPVGKTTIKDAVFASLAQLGHTRKNAASQNTELTVPLAVLGIPAPTRSIGWGAAVCAAWWQTLTSRTFPRWLVLELGTDQPGDMERFRRWLSPHIVVGAHFPEIPPHIEFFPSADALFREDWSIVSTMPAGGSVIVQADDERSEPLARSFLPQGVALLRYGFAKEAEIHIRGYRPLFSRRKGVPVPRGVRGEIVNRLSGERLLIHRPGVLGAHHLYPWAAAAAVRVALGFPLAGLDAVARRTPPTEGRMRLLEGKGGMVLIDDSYNASPVAVRAALKTLASLPQSRKIAILGDMLELGEATAQAHTAIGEHAAQSASCVIAVGVRARRIAQQAQRAGCRQVWVVTTAHEAANLVLSHPQWHTPHTAVLVKGSRGIHLEAAVRLLLAHPHRDEHLLVGSKRSA